MMVRRDFCLLEQIQRAVAELRMEGWSRQTDGSRLDEGPDVRSGDNRMPIEVPGGLTDWSSRRQVR